MIKKFEPAEKVDVHIMQDIVNSMEDLLNLLFGMKIPDDKYTESDIEVFCRSLVDGQRSDIRWLKPGSWCVGPAGCERMPWDARVDFVMFPTYIAIAILTLVMRRYPHIADTIDFYTDVMQKGYKFSTYMGLKGHGYEAEEEKLRALEILKKGEVIDYLKKNPGFSPEMYYLLNLIEG